MAAITTTRLKDILRGGGRSGALGWDSYTIEAACDELSAVGAVIGSDSVGRGRLFEVLQVQLAMLKPEVRQMLEAQPIFVVEFDRCLAFSEVDQQHGSSIVLSTGMIDLLAATIYDLYVQAEIPAALDHVLIETAENLPVSTLFPNLTLLLRYRYLRYGEKLPAFSSPLSVAALTMCRDSIHGALLFLVLHELGHIVHGHHQGDAMPRHLPFGSVIEEDINDYQRQEIEADQFALDALIEPARPLGNFWMTQSLNFFSSLELITGKRQTSHPLALNRAAHANRERLGLASPSQVDKILAGRFIKTEEAAILQGNKLIHTKHV